MPHLSLVMAVALLGSDPKPAQAPALPQPPPAAIDVVAALEDALASAIAKAEASVVAIAREKDGRGEGTTAVRGRNPNPPRLAVGVPRGLQRIDNLNGFGFDQPDYLASDFGSGVVIGEKGEILTAFSVVRGASALIVRSAGAPDFEAEVIAADPRSDLAVIAPREVDGARRPSLPPLRLGDSGRLRKGSFLLALGNPFNSARDGHASASWGILSNVARQLDAAALADQARGRLQEYPTLLQLDAKLNLGMSGGAVVDLRGDLVGLTTDAANAGGFDAQAGYAIPINALARRAIEALRQGREVEYGFLGINLSTTDGSNRVNGVTPGTPAGEGGLLLDDFILAIGDIPVVDADSLVLAVNAFAPGEPIRVRIRREGKEFDKTVFLSKLRVAGEVIATTRPDGWRGLRVDYMSTTNQNNRGINVLDAMARGGVVVAEVAPGSPADDAELKPGQIILAVEGRPIKFPADFARAVRDRKGPVRLTVDGDQIVTIK